MRSRSGVQYATITTKRCPMHDPTCAERVIGMIADYMTRRVAQTPSSLELEAAAAEREIAQYEGAIAMIRNAEARGAGYPDSAAAILNLEAEIAEKQVVARVYRKKAAEMPAFDPQAAATKLVEERCGRYQRGAHAGQLRGWAEIDVCTEGGWKKNGPGERNGRVVYPGTVVHIRINDFNGNAYLEV